MGFDCEAITIIGLRITKEDLQIPVEKPFINCQCKNNNHFNYCPDCGRQNKYGSYIEYEFIKEYKKERNEDLICDALLTVNNHIYPIYQPVEREEWLYIYLYCGIKDGPRNYEENNVIKTSLDILKDVEQLKKDLESIHLWKEENFGIYTLIDFSY